MNVCPKCGDTHLHKAGFKPTVKGPVQRWKCVANGHQFTGQEKFHHASDETKALAVTLASEGMSVRAIARTCGVYGRAATLWLEKKA